MSGKCDGMVALVTGASQGGSGTGLAVRLAAKGPGSGSARARWTASSARGRWWRSSAARPWCCRAISATRTAVATPWWRAPRRPSGRSTSFLATNSFVTGRTLMLDGGIGTFR